MPCASRHGTEMSGGRVTSPQPGAREVAGSPRPLCVAVRGAELLFSHTPCLSLFLWEVKASTELGYSYLMPGFDDRCACSNLLGGPPVQNSAEGFQMWRNLGKSSDPLKGSRKLVQLAVLF